MVITEAQCCWRLSSLLVYKEGSTNLFTPYSWSFDNLSRITQQVNQDGTSDYTYDSTSQLTAADHDYQTNESYTYDANGNRTMAGYSTGTNNRLLDDGTHTFTYDDEGNRTKKTITATGEATEYEWDHRNRLVRVTHLDSIGDPIQTLDYAYDVLDHRIEKSDTPAIGPAYTQRYVYDGEHLALKFGASALANRYLHGPVIDQILADEQVSSLSSPGDVLWPLVDNLGTVRDLAEYDSGTGNTVIVNHISYDAFGGSRTETNAAVDHLFGYTGREWDAEADLQYNRARWYDPAVGRWLSEDPIGFDAGDANLSRYVENSPTMKIDPSGLQPPAVFTSNPLDPYLRTHSAICCHDRPSGITGSISLFDYDLMHTRSPAQPPTEPPSRFNFRPLGDSFDTFINETMSGISLPFDNARGVTFEDILANYNVHTISSSELTAMPDTSGWDVGATGGTHYVAWENEIGSGNFVGVQGMHTCVSVLLCTDDGVFAGHFGSSENPTHTLRRYRYILDTPDVNAYVVFTEGVDRRILRKTLSYLRSAGVNPQAVINVDLFVDHEYMLYYRQLQRR